MPSRPGAARVAALLWCCALAATLAADSGEEAKKDAASKDPVARGKALFGTRPQKDLPSCADCHAVVPPEEEKKLKVLGPAATLYGSAAREGWRGRKSYSGIGAALQPCAKQWQERKKGVVGQQREDLVAYLRSIAPQESLPARKIRRPKLPKKMPAGDAEKGKVLIQRYCAGCHNGSWMALSFTLKEGHKRRDVVIRKMRGYDPKRKFKPKGVMSYYLLERIDDKQLADIVAYVGK